MYGPQARRQCPQLNTFHAAAFDERDGILKVVMSVLSTVGREDSARRHRLAVNGFDDAQFVGANLNQRHFAYDFLKRKFNEVKSGLQYIGLNTDFTFSSDDSSRRHFLTQVSSFLDRDFARADVHEIAPGDDEQDDQGSDAKEDQGQHRCDVKVLHGYVSFTQLGGS